MSPALIHWEHRDGSATPPGGVAGLDTQIWADAATSSAAWLGMADIVTLADPAWGAARTLTPAILLARYPGCALAAVYRPGRWWVMRRDGAWWVRPALRGCQPPLRWLSACCLPVAAGHGRGGYSGSGGFAHSASLRAVVSALGDSRSV
ncbi:hypothetical protein RIF23_19340 [Lipingzhangella sp. LS1_29]|uniref:Uncharacterized protein n=1 Tax=Lipingzhangella rawalii TaxID=2055835 RepID=A0ABU2HAZ4_9ACTN|nr:hypothetical protein [Lipingzhangella rawalii]MDS1272446.1 hypothetical protein [Lipingzhangella rawalii]